ncbi:MAG: ISKra4 family transposase [Limisphaerales bacterium]
MSNLEAIEMGLRQALLKDGGRLLEGLFDSTSLNIPDNTSRPGEKCHPNRALKVESIFGGIHLRRNYFYDEDTQRGRAPLDQALGLVNGFSPALIRLASRAAAREGYEAASQDLLEIAGIAIDGRQIQRLANVAGPQIGSQLEAGQVDDTTPVPILYVEVDGTGVPMVADELAGRKGKQPDGTAKTREAKLCATFTQTKWDEQGLPQRDYNSTTYVGSFESAEAFGLRVRREAQRRGAGRADKIVFLGDGAIWVWELQRVNFPEAIEILDLFHALEHVAGLCKGLFPSVTEAKEMTTTWFEMLKNDEVAGVIAAARKRLLELGPLPAENTLETQIGYFERNQRRMLYKTYREAGLFYGSGVVEAGCKAVIGQRLKNSGMFWTESGATSVIILRCALKGHRWNECWDRLHDSQRLKIRPAA